MTDQAGQLLFRFVRFWARRWTGTGDKIEAERGSDVMVVEAVAARCGGEASINDVAEELGLDQSGASRMVSSAVERGYLVKNSATDARRRSVVITTAGHDLISQAHLWQEHIFGRLTKNWTSTEKATFADLMARLLDAEKEMRSGFKTDD